MNTLEIEGVPAAVGPGGIVEGALTVTADRQLPPGSVSLSFRGTELAELAGGRHTIVWESTFLEQSIPISGGEEGPDGTGISPGIHRFSFRFSLPAAAPPSVQTSPRFKYGIPAGPLDWESHPGMFVDYALEAKVKLGLLHGLTRVVHVAVTDPRTALGATSRSIGPLPVGDLQVRLDVESPDVRAGQTLSGAWTLTNPQRETVRRLRIGLALKIVARGMPTDPFQPCDRSIDAFTEIGPASEAAEQTGHFEVAIPPSFAQYRNMAGQIYQSTWVMYVAIETSTLHDRLVDGPLRGYGHVVDIRLDRSGAEQPLK